MVYSSTIRIPRNNTQCKKLQSLDRGGNSKINSPTFRKQLCTIASMSSIENDSTATIQDSFKDCILTCKNRNQMHANFEKRKVPQAVSGNFAH